MSSNELCSFYKLNKFATLDLLYNLKLIKSIFAIFQILG